MATTPPSDLPKVAVTITGVLNEAMFIPLHLLDKEPPAAGTQPDLGYQTRTLTVDGKDSLVTVEFSVWGARESATSRIYRVYEAEAIIFPFSIANARDFHLITRRFEETYEDLKILQEALGPKATMTVMYLVGNMKELAAARVISITEAQAWAAARGMKYLEISVVENQGVKELFEGIIRDARNHAPRLPRESVDLRVDKLLKKRYEETRRLAQKRKKTVWTKAANGWKAPERVGNGCAVM